MIRVALLTFLFCLPLQAQPVLKHPNPDTELVDKWAWAHEEGSSGSYWVGYRFNKLMGRRVYYGSFWKDNMDPANSLYTLIGEPEKVDATLIGIRRGWQFRGNGVVRFDSKEKDGVQEKVLKEVAVLVLYNRGVPVQVAASNMSLEFKLDGDRLYWLDHVRPEESIALLTDIFKDVEFYGAQEDLVTVLGVHGQHPDVEQFATNILNSKLPSDVRERATSVLGQQNTETALATLRRVIREDASEDVQEHAVYAVSEMPTESALDLLIDIARNEKNEGIRKKAIYGLGHKASRKALAALEETIYDEADEEVQKHAVYALAHFETDAALSRLIDIANNHTSREVRKSAIYMLGDIGTEQAVEALIEIVENQ